MIRTQIYLTQNEKNQLQQLCLETGKSQSELIRSAIDGFIQSQQISKSIGFGIWKGNHEDFVSIRSEIDELHD